MNIESQPQPPTTEHMPLPAIGLTLALLAILAGLFVMFVLPYLVFRRQERRKAETIPSLGLWREPEKLPPEMVVTANGRCLDQKYLPLPAQEWIELLYGPVCDYKRDITLPSGWVLMGCFPTMVTAGGPLVALSVDRFIDPAPRLTPLRELRT